MITISTQVVGSPPWADFAISGLPVGTVACRISRKDRDKWVALPGSSQRPVLGDEWRFIDHGFPVSTTARLVEYHLESLSASGAILESGVVSWSTPSVTVGHSQGWLSDPLDPLGGVLVEVLAEGDALGWSSSSSLLQPISGPPISASMPRTMQQPWSVTTDVVEDAVSIREMIEGGGVLLLRGDPECLVHSTGVAYIQVDSPTMSWRTPHEAGRWFTLYGTEVKAPAILQVVSARTYADDLAEHPTYADSKAALPTYLERVRG